MKHLFPEEHEITKDLSQEWTLECERLMHVMLETMKAKGDGRDETSCVWHRLPFPDGMLTIIEQKSERMQPLLAKFNPYGDPSLCPVHWDKAIEEALDVATYWVFFAAILEMLKKRASWSERMQRGELHG